MFNTFKDHKMMLAYCRYYSVAVCGVVSLSLTQTILSPNNYNIEAKQLQNKCDNKMKQVISFYNTRFTIQGNFQVTRKRVRSLNYCGTYPRGPITRPPSCTTPRHLTIYHTLIFVNCFDLLIG